MSNQRRARRFGLIGMSALIAAAVTGSLVTKAEAGSWQPGRYVCTEAWSTPHSVGADRCRDHGWTIMARLVVGPHGVLRYNNLPPCPYEDGSRVTLRCIWLGQERANGEGRTYWFATHRPLMPHYVWPSSPANHGWEWVDHELADALAEGGSLHADTRRWERCVVNVGPTTVVRCADGTREVS